MKRLTLILFLHSHILKKNIFFFFEGSKKISVALQCDNKNVCMINTCDIIWFVITHT